MSNFRRWLSLVNPWYWVKALLQRIGTMTEGRGFLKAGLILGCAVFVVLVIVGMWWSRAPSQFDVMAQAQNRAEAQGHSLAVGYTTAATLEHLMQTLLDKPGGYLMNDVMPPGLWLDNMPNWELGVVIQSRDMARALRRDMSRSQSQSTEDPDLVIAEPQFHFDTGSWILPSAEGEYRRGLRALDSYLNRLTVTGNARAEFHPRTDSLANWLGDVSTRLGSLSQRLSNSVGGRVYGVGMDPESFSETPWLEIDDIFYEARGSAWALVHLLKAVEHDFAPVLEQRNAAASLRQIIRELEATQRPLRSPMVLNGDGFGMVANHSLVMANYLSRANAAVIDLRQLLQSN
ncbi:DUF2333 family protein [Salinispirillum marinum]|uniref:DUF2333 family protein n=2 Tax=Saccharospirillaceae TaxID=255527 RepID=A0ABV8BIX9_9GAMM